MKTILYLVRHSEPMLKDIEKESTSEEIFIINKKIPLSCDGEMLANKVSMMDEFKGIDVIWSSSYSRAMSTAKYFAKVNNLKINIDENLGERKQGIKTWDELPKDFLHQQFLNPNFKIGDGESQIDVTNRMYNTIMKIVKENLGKKILILSHQVAITFFLKNWCDIKYENNYTFNGKPFFDGLWHYCQAFKLTFEDEALQDIELIN